MAKVAILKGTGKFTNEGGVDVHYPIFKLLLSNGEDSIEIKLDKIQKKLIPFMFELVDTDVLTEDEQGNECKLYELKPRVLQNS